jgi:hypothetical protein
MFGWLSRGILLRHRLRATAWAVIANSDAEKTGISGGIHRTVGVKPA